MLNRLEYMGRAGNNRIFMTRYPGFLVVTPMLGWLRSGWKTAM
jgi:hypothetical protein